MAENKYSALARRLVSYSTDPWNELAWTLLSNGRLKSKVPPTIDPFSRQIVQNADGSISTDQTLGVTLDDGVMTIPTIVNGKKVSDDEAIRHALATRQHYGIHGDIETANEYGEKLHEAQGGRYPNKLERAFSALGKLKEEIQQWD